MASSGTASTARRSRSVSSNRPPLRKGTSPMRGCTLLVGSGDCGLFSPSKNRVLSRSR